MRAAKDLRAYRIDKAVERRLAGLAEVGGRLKLIVAVSGGRDSCVLLRALAGVEREIGLVVAHVDHGLRDESGRDALFVERLAAEYQLPLELYRAPKRPVEENLEAWARRVRYSFLEQCRQKHRGDWIATAHHQQDQAETLLHRLLSGRLATEAYAISGVDLRRRIVRPLLGVGKGDVDYYADVRGLSWVDDLSNRDLMRTRNRIRRRLLPILESWFNPRLVEGLSRSAERLAHDEDFLWELAEREHEKCFSTDRKSPGGKRIGDLEEALRWRVLKLEAERQLGEQGAKLGYRALAELSGRFAERCGEKREIQLGVGVSCEIGGDRLRFIRTPRCEEAVGRDSATEAAADEAAANEVEGEESSNVVNR